MSRSVWKTPIILNEKIQKFDKKIKIIKRNFIISSDFLNKKVSVYNGKVFVNIFIDKNKIGYKFGEFVYTRKPCMHKQKKNNKKK